MIPPATLAVLAIMSPQALLALGLLAYTLTIAIYRLTFHPLANIPGPKLAAITQLYQTFYCYYRNESRFYQHIDHLHEQYGPVVRITPSEVSLNDPSNYGKIYHVGTKYYKAASYYRVFGAPAAFFTTIPNRLHAARRAPVNPFFSRRGVQSLEPLVQEKARVLVARLRRELDTKGDCELHDLFSALSVDVASEYAFDDCYGLLDAEGYGKAFAGMVRGVLRSFWFFMQSATVEAVALRLPRWVSEINPAIKHYNALVDGTRQKVADTKKQVDSGQARPLRRSIFHELLTTPMTQGDGDASRPPSVDDMTDIALTIIVAAAAATGNALSMIAYHVLSNVEIRDGLRAELLEAFPDEHQPMQWASLEKLPFLAAVIKEGLRLSYGVIGRLPRVVPEPGAVFNGHKIPAGSIVGMSSWTMHRTPSIFPDPDKFDPGRWMDPAATRRLSPYLVSFGKDSRQCIGMPLAYCELYVTVATMFRSLGGDLEVHGTRPEDLVFEDYFSGYHPEKANPFRVRRVARQA
ncbi:benzoate 4-monooxygenase cytochrome p450 [Diplodia corticola]|uniref:Benzoate 4-monooxygenase cytochrome p450 n=1 Tax=Diplodia corticola TaxID=236234 RepID=A0A1J9QVT3_9PEZI|nr:benzoate 4-monooxygenase cytochrome p450 [Diplodia corticola]OJD32106.1 benzoate 4-monooxygenase cytochrome p450 [Diplodia corticola]